jgi:DnaA family protein
MSVRLPERPRHDRSIEAPLSQLALPLQLQDHAVFESFWPAGNDTLVSYLAELAASGNNPGCWIRGPAATGKTHLLQAVCERAGDRAVYVPLASLKEAGPGILEGLSSRQFVCLDDVHLVAGDADWDLALFELYNMIADAGGVVLATAPAAARECGFGLADLESRFSLLPTFRLHSLGEADRIRALQLRARFRGLDLPDDTANFLLNRSKRDMASLYTLLDQLDVAALEAKRRLTIPFVKETLDSLKQC